MEFFSFDTKWHKFSRPLHVFQSKIYFSRFNSIRYYKVKYVFYPRNKPIHRCIFVPIIMPPIFFFFSILKTILQIRFFPQSFPFSLFNVSKRISKWMWFIAFPFPFISRKEKKNREKSMKIRLRSTVTGRNILLLDEIPFISRWQFFQCILFYEVCTRRKW